MPYSQITLTQFTAQISDLMDDITNVYWKVPEIYYAVWEGMRVFGALTNYWRARGAFNIDPSSTFYDLSVQLPVLRSRVYTLDQMVREIQFMLLENPSGIAGTGMSGQVTITSILTSIQSARNRFVIDAKIPVSIHSTLGAPDPPNGMVTFEQDSIYVHRAAWEDSSNGTITNLWRQDEWAADKGLQDWTINPSSPIAYSEAANAPLQLQLIPPQVNSGVVQALTVDSLLIDMNNPAATFGVPDEWVHAIKYAALSQILSSEGQIKDMVRAEYAENRYKQAIDFAKDARSILRLLVNNLPVEIDALAAIDAGDYPWQYMTGSPQQAGVLYDILTAVPGILDQIYGTTVDVAQTAPLPGPTDFIQMGAEEMDILKDYVCHVLTFKCGGAELKSSISGYDSFMQQIAGRKGINKAKIKNLIPLFGQPQKEQAERPDRVEV